MMPKYYVCCKVGKESDLGLWDGDIIDIIPDNIDPGRLTRLHHAIFHMELTKEQLADLLEQPTNQDLVKTERMKHFFMNYANSSLSINQEDNLRNSKVSVEPIPIDVSEFKDYRVDDAKVVSRIIALAVEK